MFNGFQEWFERRFSADYAWWRALTRNLSYRDRSEDICPQKKAVYGSRNKRV